MICPKYQSQRSVKDEMKRKIEPKSIIMHPKDMQALNPCLSISQTDKKLAGKYIIRSEYLAIFKTDLLSSGFIFSMIFRFVLKDP